MNDLKEIIEALKQTRTETKTKVEDSILWESAIKIYISQEIGKQRKSETMQGTRPKPFSPASNLATKKQINFLKKEGVKIKENLTKQEAKTMISDYINNLKRKNI